MAAGVKVTESVWPAPPPSTVPPGGVYANVPATSAVAFNCVASSGVPALMSAGFGHVMSGVALSTVIATVAVAGL